MKINFMNQEFKTKNEFKKYVSENLNMMYGFYDETTEEFKFLKALYERHPHYNNEYTKFQIIPLLHGGVEICKVFNGTFTKFSKHSCIDGKMKSIDERTKMLFRESIQEQIQSYIKEKKCQFCESIENLQVDHIIPFSKIMKEFPHDVDMKYNTETHKYEITNEILEKWKEHHRNNAYYRTLCQSCNLREYHKTQKYMNNYK